VVGETILYLGILPAFSLRTGEAGGGPACWCGMDGARIRADVPENRSFTSRIGESGLWSDRPTYLLAESATNGSCSGPLFS